ncbi:MAG: hypothetical protein Q9195_008047, partial [Heterodermia aff. obscurata]
MTVPLILEDICHAPNQAGIKALQPLDFVACGGGPMKSAVAEELSSKGVRLLNHCGATEIGALAPIFNPTSEYDWHYFVIRDDLNLRLEDAPKKPGCVKLVGRAPGWDKDFVVQDFLEPNPKAPRTQFRFLGRADDLIVLANGEKIRTTGLEATVASDPRITDAIAFGEGHDQLGLIVEAAPDVELDCSNTEQAESFRESIWPAVEKGNKEVDSHGTISKDMIIEASSVGRPLERTAKGSLARKEIYDSFTTEIDTLYSQTESANIEPLPDLQDTQGLENYLREALSNILGLTAETSPISVDEDIFELGMNSLQATRLYNMLQSALQETHVAERASSTINKGFVYSHPTISSQIRALASLASDKDGMTNGTEHSRTEIMKKAVEKHHNAIVAMDVDVACNGSQRLMDLDGKIVVLTGSTGNLGSNLVYNMAQDPEVSLIYCLNRSSTAQTDQHERQQRAFNKAGIRLPTHLWAKIKPIEVKPQQPNFGLDPDVNSQLKQASHIIHNAWPMDFNRACVSFETQFQYLDSIIQLALRSTSPAPPRLLFTSSIATVAHYPSKTSQSHVPEIPMDDPAVTAPFGYPEAKWVCEQILLQSAKTHPARFEPIIVRVGQLTGSTEGPATWSATEHLPSMFKSAQTLGALPGIEG